MSKAALLASSFTAVVKADGLVVPCKERTIGYEHNYEIYTIPPYPADSTPGNTPPADRVMAWKVSAEHTDPKAYIPYPWPGTAFEVLIKGHKDYNVKMTKDGNHPFRGQFYVNINRVTPGGKYILLRSFYISDFNTCTFPGNVDEANIPTLQMEVRRIS